MRQDERCTYCLRSATTLDHVPPKSFFPKPRPNDLITVPSCQPCNQAGARDDEYLRRVLFLRDDVRDHAEAARLWPTEVRAIEKPTKAGMRQTFVDNLREAELVDLRGRRIGDQTVYLVERHRVAQVASRIAKGLFRHKTGHALPIDFVATAVVEETLVDAQYADPHLSLSTTVSGIKAHLLEFAPTVIGQGTFSYRCAFSEGDLRNSAWLLVFYEAAAFVVLTTHRSKAAPASFPYNFPLEQRSP